MDVDIYADFKQERQEQEHKQVLSVVVGCLLFLFFFFRFLFANIASYLLIAFCLFSRSNFPFVDCNTRMLMNIVYLFVYIHIHKRLSLSASVDMKFYLRKVCFPKAYQFARVCLVKMAGLPS